MHDGKNNMMLCLWCHKHSPGASHKSALVIGSSNLKYGSVVAYEKSSLLCHCVCVCVCVNVCVCV